MITFKLNHVNITKASRTSSWPLTKTVLSEPTIHLSWSLVVTQGNEGAGLLKNWFQRGPERQGGWTRSFSPLATQDRLALRTWWHKRFVTSFSTVLHTFLLPLFTHFYFLVFFLLFFELILFPVVCISPFLYRPTSVIVFVTFCLSKKKKQEARFAVNGFFFALT